MHDRLSHPSTSSSSSASPWFSVSPWSSSVFGSRLGHPRGKLSVDIRSSSSLYHYSYLLHLYPVYPFLIGFISLLSFFFFSLKYHSLYLANCKFLLRGQPTIITFLYPYFFGIFLVYPFLFSLFSLSLILPFLSFSPSSNTSQPIPRQLA